MFKELGKSTWIAHVIEHPSKTRFFPWFLYNTAVHCSLFIVQSCMLLQHSLTTDACYIMYEQRRLFIMIVPTIHEQAVPTCMNKPLNNHVQDGQLKHVLSCQHVKTSCAFLRGCVDSKSTKIKRSALRIQCRKTKIKIWCSADMESYCTFLLD